MYLRLLLAATISISSAVSAAHAGNYRVPRWQSSGSARLHDSPGDDTLWDSPGDDTLWDSPGDDTYDSPGDDTYDSPGDDTYDSPGDDTFWDWLGIGEIWHFLFSR